MQRFLAMPREANRAQVGMFDNAPALIQSLLGGNCVALSFIIALLLNIVLPKDDGDAGKAAPAMAEAQGPDSPADASADAENGDGEA